MQRALSSDFGHAVSAKRRPSCILPSLHLGEEICPDDEYFRIIRVSTRELLQWCFLKIQRFSNPNANVDIASGTLTQSSLGCKMLSTTPPSSDGLELLESVRKLLMKERLCVAEKEFQSISPKYIAEEQTLRHLRLNNRSWLFCHNRGVQSSLQHSILIVHH